VTSDSSNPQDAPPVPPDPAAALSQIVDDEDKTLEAEYWAVDQVLAGITPEDIVADLLEQGWSSDRAEEIAEQARKITRSQRGVVTREDIARGMSIKYRKGQRRTAILIRLVLLAFAILIVWAVAKMDLGRRDQPTGTGNSSPRILQQNGSDGSHNQVGPTTRDQFNKQISP
jgi:hypothetical protein